MIFLIKISCLVELPEKPDFACKFEDSKEAIRQIPKEKSGLYFFYGGTQNKELLYIGKAGKLRDRVLDHLKKRKSSNTRYIADHFKRVEVYYLDDLVLLDIAETLLINTLKPKLNAEKVWTYQTEKHSSEWTNEEEEVSEEDIRNMYLRVNL
jgi:hypothetical protein